jgi:hypothetical protein
MSYRTNQYFNLVSAGESYKNNGSTVRLDKGDNREFSYPSRLIRTIDSSGALNTKELKRGYIRSLNDSVQGYNIPIRKCMFQFNPQTLNQYVTANTALLNVLQQDPAQWAQPLAADVSFNFQLFFDRTMEVNNPEAGDDQLSRGIDLNGDGTNVWESLPPSQIGVLHDLGVLFSVIGVGVSSTQRAYAERILADQITTEINNQISTADPEDTAGADSVTEFEGATTNLSTLLDFNVGNTGFLIPLPVRAVFSSLYIVEGLARSVGVIFSKFNSSMVPMQCTVDLNLEAKYIGFAKKKTFFTDVLEKRRESELNQYLSTQQERESLHSALNNEVQSVNINFSPHRDYPSDPFTIDELGQANIRVFGELIPAKTGRPRDSITALFAAGESVSIDAKLSGTIYRYDDFFKNTLRGLTNEQMVEKFLEQGFSYSAQKVIDNGCITIYHVSKDASGSEYTTATTGDEWKDLAGKIRSAGSTLYSFQGLTNQYDSYPPYDSSLYYYAVRYELTMSATLNGYTTSTTATSWFMSHLTYSGRGWNGQKGTGFDLGIRIAVEWPDYVSEPFGDTVTDTDTGNGSGGSNNNNSQTSVEDSARNRIPGKYQ